MISLLIVAHGNLGESLIQCATYVLGQRPEALEHLDLVACDDADDILEQARELVQALDKGEGVLILTDVFGATPCNTVCKLIESDRVEAVSGVNLPMLLKALTYRDQDMATLVSKAVTGGQTGIFQVQAPQPPHA